MIFKLFFNLKIKRISLKNGHTACVYFSRNVITKTTLERLEDGLKTVLFQTKLMVGGFPVKKFAHKIVQNPFIARENAELRLVHGYYNLTKNNLYFLNPSDRVLINFIITRSYEDIVNELPHILYHSKKQNSRLYSIPSDRYLNPKDYKAGDAVVHVTGRHIEFKTNKFLKRADASRLVEQFKDAKVGEYRLCLSVLYNEIADNFSMEEYVKIATSIGFRAEHLSMISQSECASVFPTIDSLAEALQHYNVKWSVYVQEHNNYLETHLNNILTYTTQENVRSEVYVLLDRIQRSKAFQGSVQPNKLFKSLTNFKGFDSGGNQIQSDSLEGPEDIISDVTDWFDCD